MATSEPQHDLVESEVEYFQQSETEDERSESNPVPKKRRISVCKFKHSWSLPAHISPSSKGASFAYCRLCSSHFSISHGGFNDIKRHVSGSVHLQRLRSLRGSSSITWFMPKDTTDHQRSVISAEVQMANFIALHNLLFQTADHLSDLFSKMFPDSKIAADFACKHTKTKAICCDALDPYYKKPVVEFAKTSPFNLLCDESNDKGAAVKLLTILVRFFDSVHGHGLVIVGLAKPEKMAAAWKRL